jgi:hypothetical protein
MTITINPAKHYAAIHLTDEMATFGGLPKRWITGIGLPSEEDTLEPYFSMNTASYDRKVEVTTPRLGYANVALSGGYNRENVTLDGKQMATLANTLLKRIGTDYRPVKFVTVDGKNSVKAGNGIVYAAMTEGEAQRNLDFALANLASYLNWEQYGREEARKREENLRRIEQEKRQAEVRAKAEAEEKRQAQEKLYKERAEGLRHYNVANGTNYGTWTGAGIYSEQTIQKWIDLAKQANALRKSTLTLSQQISAATIGASKLYANSIVNPFADGGSIRNGNSIFKSRF